MYKMIVFDCDGTLVDSSVMISMMHKGYHLMFPEREELPYEHFIPCYFMTDEEILTYLNIPIKNRLRFEELCFRQDGDFSLHVQTFDGINEVLKELLQQGYQLGIATSRSYETFAELEDQLDKEVYDSLSIIGVQDVVKHTKPSPDVLYYIMEKGKFKADDLLFVGDSINDALCSQAAGVDFAWAKWGMVNYEPLPYTYVLNSPRELHTILNMKKKEA